MTKTRGIFDSDLKQSFIRGFEVVDTNKRKYPLLNIILPQRATNLSAGYDIRCPFNITIPPRESVTIHTEIKAYMQQDEYLDINIRSSMAIKNNLRLSNCVPIVDADYYSNPDNDGNIILKIINEGDDCIFIKENERIAQGIFKKYLITDDDNPLEFHRSGGIGSSGTV